LFEGIDKRHIISEGVILSEKILEKDVKFAYIDRFEFYERAKNAYGVVATTERALYA
jgi:L-fucose mutarotase